MTTTPFESLTNPYVGPRTFSYDQRALFFGREREARDLLARVVSERLLLFYAQSGAGKSSLLHTRLIPQLRAEEGFFVLPVGRVSGALPTDVGTVDNIYLFNLMSSIDPRQVDPAALAQLTLRDFLAHLVTADGEQWTYDPAALLAAAPNGDPRYVLIIDQFEEIITTHPDRWQERVAFFQQLNQAMLADPQLWVVLTLREDYVASLDPFTHLLVDRLRARFYMQRMDVQSALEAVKKPALLGNRPFASGVAETLVDNLRLIRVLGTEPMMPGPLVDDGGTLGQSEPERRAAALGQYIEPVQLQVVCYQLWGNLKAHPPGPITAADLPLGYIDQALTQFYTDALHKTLHDPGVQAAGISERFLRHWFSHALITEAGTRGIVYRDDARGRTANLPNAAIDRLTQQFLLRTEVRAGSAWIELVHDRFIEPIVTANQAWQASYQNPVASAYQAWQEAGRSPTQLLRPPQLTVAQTYAGRHPNDVTPEEAQFLAESERQAALEQAAAQQTTRRRRMVAMAAVAVITILSILSLIAWNNALEAHRQSLIAWNNALEAGRQRQTAEANAGLAATRAVEAQTAQSLAETNASIAVTREAEAQIERRNAERQARMAQANQLAANAQAEIDSSASLPLILARAAVLTTWLTDTQLITQSFVTRAADNALRAAVQQAEALPWQSTLPLDRRLRHTAAVRAVAFSPDGATLVSAGEDMTVRLWDTHTGAARGVLIGHTANVYAAAFSPALKGHPQTIASGGQDETIRLWDAPSGHLRRVLRGHLGWVNGVAFSPDGKFLASASEDQTVRIWDVANGQEVKLLAGHTDQVTAVAFSPDGKILASASEDTTVRLWDVTTGQVVRQLMGHEDAVKSVAFSPDGKILASASEDTTVRLWDVTTGQEVNQLIDHLDAVMAVAFSPDGQILASASRDSTIELWEVTSGQPLSILFGHFIGVLVVAFSPDGQTLASGSEDTTVRVWSAQAPFNDGQALLAPSGHSGPIAALAYSPAPAGHPQTLASASQDMLVQLWDATSGELMHSLAGHEDAVTSVAYSPDGKTLASASADMTVRLWNVESGEPLSLLEGHEDAVTSVAYSPDGATLASASADTTVRLWNVESGEPLSLLAGHEDAVTSVAYSPDGATLASASADMTVRMWDAATGEPLRVLSGHEAAITSVAFSPDGATLASASADTTVRLWNAASGAPIRVLAGHEAVVNAIAFSPDGATLASASADQTVRLWDAASGEPVRVMRGHTDIVNAVVFSPDGKL